jgi:hypothetical protein
MSAKNQAWKDALGLFIVMVVLHFAWRLVAKTKDSVGDIFGLSAITALFIYFLKRKDLFD